MLLFATCTSSWNTYVRPHTTVGSHRSLTVCLWAPRGSQGLTPCQTQRKYIQEVIAGLTFAATLVRRGGQGHQARGCREVAYND
jgi:hypothetical protein